MSHPDYSAAVWQYFNEARHAGAWSAGVAEISVRVNTPGSRAVMQLQLKLRDGAIADTRFQVYGCVSAIACGAWLAEWLVGKNQAQAAALTAEDIYSALQLSTVKRHCALLAEDAVKTLIDQWGQRDRSQMKATA